MYYPFISIAPDIRPLRTTPVSEKGEEYHVKTARHYVGRINTAVVNDFRLKYETHSAFFRGQWGTKEDIETFLMDGRYTNKKTALGRNIVSPMVNRLKGSAANMGIAASASVSTQMAKTRKEQELARVMMMQQVATTSPVMAAAISAREPVEETPEDTLAMFENSYQDSRVRAANSLISMMSQCNGFEQLRMEFAERLALSGMIGAHMRRHGSDIVWDPLPSEDILWDQLACRNDLSDAEWVGCASLMDISAIAETYNPPEETLKMLEKSMQRSSPFTTQQQFVYPEGKPRVFTVYWKDMEYKNFGYVMDAGEPTLVCLDKEYNGGVEYSDSDLVDPPANDLNKKFFQGGGKKVRRAIECVRSCVFIPREYLGVKSVNGQPAVADMVLDYGLYPIQESDPFNFSVVKMPIKLSVWAMTDGYISAPVNDAIMPQRFINRVHSNIDWLISKSGGKSPIYDPRSILPDHMDEAEVRRAFKEGDPVALDSSISGGINNSIGTYDATPGPGLYNMFTLVERAAQDANAATGINDPAQGVPTGGEQLVGVTQLLLQQTSIILTPYYDALWRLFEQMHQADAQAGTQFYAQFPWRLRQLVGDQDADAILSDPNATLEGFRVSVIRDINEEQRRKQADQLILMLLQYQLLDPVYASNLLGRSYEDEVFAAARKFSAERMKAAQQEQQQQAQAQQAQVMAAEAARIQDEQNSVYEDAMRATENEAKLRSKNAQPFMQAQAKAAFPEPANTQFPPQ